MKRTIIMLLKCCWIIANGKNIPVSKKMCDNQHSSHSRSAEQADKSSNTNNILKESFQMDAVMCGYDIQLHGALVQVTSKSSVLYQTSNTASVLADLKRTVPH